MKPKDTKSENNIKFPIVVKEFENVKFPNIEDVVENHFKKLKYYTYDRENDPIFDLFFHICFEMFLLTPDWYKWDKNKTIVEYPELLKYESNDYLDENTEIGSSIKNIPLEWYYSHDCLFLNGNPYLFPNGVHYQIFKFEIEDFIDNQLPKLNLPLIMKKNYDKVIEMRQVFPTLFIWGGRENISFLEIIVKQFPLELTQFIIRQLFKNFYKYRIGFPDLWMFNENEDKLKLVEVKRFRENIMEHQKWWLNKLYEFDIDVSVIRVKNYKRNC